MPVLDYDDTMTELFARAIVLQRRVTTLVELLKRTDVPIAAVRDASTRLHEQTAEFAHLANALPDVAPTAWAASADANQRHHLRRTD